MEEERGVEIEKESVCGLNCVRNTFWTVLDDYWDEEIGLEIYCKAYDIT